MSDRPRGKTILRIVDFLVGCSTVSPRVNFVSVPTLIHSPGNLDKDRRGLLSVHLNTS